MAEQENVFRFIVDSLKVAGSPYNIINDELIMAQCQVDVPSSFFRPARTEILNMQMVCQAELLDKYPGSELVTLGSYRLQWLVDGIRRRGLIFRGMLPYDLDPRKAQREIVALLAQPVDFFFEHPQLTYQPHLLVNFKVCRETDERFEDLYSLVINLVNGKIVSGLISKLLTKKLTANLPKKSSLEKRQISFRDGYQAIVNHLKWLLQHQDPQWITNAKLRWEEELQYLEKYYHDNREEEVDEPGFYRRAAEVYRKFRPVIQILPINVGLLFLPLVRYSISSRGSERQLAPIIYDPLNQKVSSSSANLIHQTDKE